MGGVIGGLTGYLYVQLYGCEDGCMIRSNPLLMTAYGVLLGGLLFNIIETEWNKRKSKTKQNYGE
jgi:hypothetical protein